MRWMVWNGLMGVFRQISLSREFLRCSMFPIMLCAKPTFMVRTCICLVCFLSLIFCFVTFAHASFLHVTQWFLLFTNHITQASTHYTGNCKLLEHDVCACRLCFISVNQTLTFLTTPSSSRFQFCMNDAGNRLAALSQFGLLPKLFGNDLSKMFRQRYYGDLTLVPKFTTAHKCKFY